MKKILLFEKTKDNIDYVSKVTGYAFTHIGRIKKADSKSFATKEGIHILNALRTFLSFARGIWVSPVLAVGFHHDKKNWDYSRFSALVFHFFWPSF